MLRSRTSARSRAERSSAMNPQPFRISSEFLEDIPYEILRERRLEVLTGLPAEEVIERQPFFEDERKDE
jgi:hypothetical protein